MSPNFNLAGPCQSDIHSSRISIKENSAEHHYICVDGTEKLIPVERYVLESVNGWLLDPISFPDIPQIIYLQLHGVPSALLEKSLPNALELLRCNSVAVPENCTMEEYESVLDKLFLLRRFRELWKSKLGRCCDLYKTVKLLYPNGDIVIKASSDIFGKPLDRLMNPTNMFPYENCYHSDDKNPSITWSFPVQVTVTSYRLRCDIDHILRTWRLRGSDDGIVWVTLSDHANDTTLNRDVVGHMFTVPVIQAFRNIQLEFCGRTLWSNGEFHDGIFLRIMHVAFFGFI